MSLAVDDIRSVFIDLAMQERDVESLKPDESKRLSIEESDCVPAGFQCPEIHWQDFPTPNFDCSYSTSAADTSGLFFRVAPGWAPHGSDRPREASRSVAGNDTTTRFPALPDFTTL
ncbi:hypothetical protein [Pseudomonas aeruginosa]|nr:hypothetical protein DY948_17325 [Pseudomonas aeruginosa]